MKAQAIIEAIELALFSERQSASFIFVDLENSRNYLCRIDSCKRNAYAKGLCNAHYIRERKGMDMGKPIRPSRRHDKCSVCGEKCGTKGGWGMCKQHYRSSRYRAIKDACISAMGGCCQSCGGVFHRSVYDFHHIGGKDVDPSRMMASSSPSSIAEELNKCILLCANCHRVTHHNNDQEALKLYTESES